MEVVANNYLPGEQHLIDKIVYELKAQGIFDQFRKECFADVDTKPAYQNLRQRVEGSVTGFLKEQSWRPDMNKNQVREMLRKTITESGYLETGVERIVDQVVNPKINTVFLPKVEEVVYSYLGIKKPNRNEGIKSEQCDLLPTDLEAVSPESEPVDKKDDKSTENFQDMDESKTEEDESPPFEPLDEQSMYVPQEENSVDSHLSGFSGLVSHESNQSNENKVSHMEQDSQMSRNSSDSRLSIVTSDENSKMNICEDSQSKSIKSGDSNHKHDTSDKTKHKTSDKHKSRSESKSDRDRKSSRDSKSRHSYSSKDKDKSHDKKDLKSTNSSKSDKEKDKLKDKSDKDRGKGASNSSSKYSNHSSSSSGSSKDKNVKKDPSRSEKDKSDRDKIRSSYKDSKPRDKSSDSKSRDKSFSSDKHKHSSTSSHSDRHKKDKDKKKDTKSKDDHYSSKDKKNDRRSTDRDSNDGQSSKQSYPTTASDSQTTQSQKTAQDSSHGGGDSGNSEQTENTTKAPIIITGAVENSEVTISSPEMQRVKVFKPKCASNIQEALRLMKIRKQLAKLEKQNQLSLATVDVNTPILLSSSINLDDLKQNCFEDEKSKQETLNSKIMSELEVVPSPLQNTVISQDNWDAMEAKLREEVYSEFKDFKDDSLDDSVEDRGQTFEAEGTESQQEMEESKTEEECKYFESVDIKQIDFLRFVDQFIGRCEKGGCVRDGNVHKRKIEDNDVRNNNKQFVIIPEKKTRIAKKNKDRTYNNAEISPSEKFPLPLSPADSDKSVGRRDETVIVPLKPKRNCISKASNQRYSSDDLYKPRPTFTSSRRRGAKNLEN
ncbi:biorientation of chromosomes in cell division protein 1-like 1 [Tenebrio molitor]|uniref:biorientation of chromosomes in cell division protein 1-like 1 n=1 Tax=Tenebrio molitor TaxID=7067 RepID=UPI0036249DCF